jgi:hypothetical protein
MQPWQLDMLKQVSCDEDLIIVLTGLWGSSDELARAKTEAAVYAKTLQEMGYSKRRAERVASRKYGLQFYGQAKFSYGTDVALLVRDPNHPLRHKNLRLSEDGEIGVSSTFRGREVDYYNKFPEDFLKEWPRWFFTDPYGVAIYPSGRVEKWWGPFGESTVKRGGRWWSR